MPFHNTNRNGTISKCHRHIGLSATTSTESNNSTWNRLISVFFSLSSIYTALAADNYKCGKHVPTIFTFVNLHISQCRLRATINNSSVVWCTDAVFPAINGNVSLVTLWIKKNRQYPFWKIWRRHEIAKCGAKFHSGLRHEFPLKRHRWMLHVRQRKRV